MRLTAKWLEVAAAAAAGAAAGGRYRVVVPERVQQRLQRCELVSTCAMARS